MRGIFCLIYFAGLLCCKNAFSDGCLCCSDITDNNSKPGLRKCLLGAGKAILHQLEDTASDVCDPTIVLA